MRAAGVKAVSPAKRGRSDATRLDAGEHTVMLMGPTARVSIIDALPSCRFAAANLKLPPVVCRTASQSRSGCASNEKASSVFSIREAGVLDAALDAALPPCGHLQMHQLRRVVGRRLTLADGLLGRGLPLRRDR